MFSIDSRAVPHISEPTLLFVLFSSSGVSLRWFIRCDANRTLVCPCFYVIAWAELIFFLFFFFFLHNNFGRKSELDLEESSERLNELRSTFNESSKCRPSVNIFRIQKTLGAISATLLARTSLQDRTFFF